MTVRSATRSESPSRAPAGTLEGRACRYEVVPLFSVFMLRCLFLETDFETCLLQMQTPCQNGGECRPDESPSGYTCDCPEGFTGRDCESGEHFVLCSDFLLKG